MRVLIDAHMVGSGETGNETYIVNLLHELSQLPGLMCGATLSPGSVLPPYLSEVIPIPLHRSGNWIRLFSALPVASRNWAADLLHVTYIGPLFSPCPVVVTVHDVAFRRHPEFFSPRDRLLFATLLPNTLRHASAVITVSNHAQQELLDLFPYLKGKVYVTPEAPSRIFHQVDKEKALTAIRSHYPIYSDFILAVGNLQPRKNIVRLVDAFAQVRREGFPIQLVLVGKAQWRASEIAMRVKYLGLENDVVFTGYVADEDLVLLYNAAKVFVYPSLYEGFGLPIVEAMACGIPVVTSNVSSMPEVAGNAAILVDPFNPEEVGQAILKILNSPDLMASLSRAGIRQSQKFSWRKTAEETFAVYQTALHLRKG